MIVTLKCHCERLAIVKLAMDNSSSYRNNLITSAMPLQLTGFAPVVNSNSTGTVNFVVNICPTGHIGIKNSTEVKNESTDHDALLEGIDVDDLFSDI